MKSPISFFFCPLSPKGGLLITEINKSPPAGGDLGAEKRDGLPKQIQVLPFTVGIINY